MKRSTFIPFTFALALVAPLGACGSSNKAQRDDDVVSMRAQDYDIESEGEVVKACGLDTSRSYFAYNSSDLTDDDKVLLEDVGRCLTSGRLQGRSVLVTGYTDEQATPRTTTRSAWNEAEPWRQNWPPAVSPRPASSSVRAARGERAVSRMRAAPSTVRSTSVS